MRLRTGVAAITGDPIPLIRRAVLDRVLRDDVGGAQQTAQDRGRPRGAAIEVVSNSRPLECDSLWFAHFDSEIMIRHLPRAEMMAKSGLPDPERAPIRQSGTGLGS